MANPVKPSAGVQSITNPARKVYNEFLYILGGAPLTTANIVPIVVHLMEIVEKIPNLAGLERKELVLDVINRGADALGASSEVKNIINTTVPFVIDTVIKAIKDEIDGLSKKTKYFGKGCIC